MTTGAWARVGVADGIENQCYVLAVNRLGKNPNGDTYSGGSAILDFMGQPMQDCEDQLRIASASLSASGLETFRQFFPASMDHDAFTIEA